MLNMIGNWDEGIKMKSENHIKVWYSDGSVGHYDTVQEAQNEIEEQVIGSNFETTVDAVQVVNANDEEDDDEDMLACEWSVKLVKLPPGETE